MRLLTVTNMWPSRERPGWGTFVKSQVDSLVGAGISNTLYVIEGWRSAAQYFRAVRELPLLAHRCAADLVHAHFGYTGAAALGVKLPLVVSLCGTDLLGRPDGKGGLTLKSRALVRVSVHAARRADAVIVKTEQLRQRIAGVPEVEVIPNGVNIEQFKPVALEAARRSLGWRLGGKVLLFAANRDEPRKNFPLAAAVERGLRGRGMDVRLECVFGKPHSTIVQAMSGADVLLLPSLQEGSPNVVKEAMACGLPVVAAPAGDCGELLRHCFPSTVAERTEEAFTAATARVLAAESRSNGRTLIVAAGLTVEATAQRIIAVYERVLRRQNAGVLKRNAPATRG